MSEKIREIEADLRTVEADLSDLREIYSTDGFNVILQSSLNHNTLAQIVVSDDGAVDVIDCLRLLLHKRRNRLQDELEAERTKEQ